MQVQLAAKDSTIAALVKQNELADQIISRYQKMTANNEQIITRIDPAQLAVCQSQVRDDQQVIKDFTREIEQLKAKVTTTKFIYGIGGTLFGFTADRAFGGK